MKKQILLQKTLLILLYLTINQKRILFQFCLIIKSFMIILKITIPIIIKRYLK